MSSKKKKMAFLYTYKNYKNQLNSRIKYKDSEVHTFIINGAIILHRWVKL